jgi:hypothetical protein
MADLDRLAALQAENARLIALLESHGIEWRRPPAPEQRHDEGVRDRTFADHSNSRNLRRPLRANIQRRGEEAARNAAKERTLVHH